MRIITMMDLRGSPISGHRPPGLQRSVAFIHENADSDIGLAEIAAAAATECDTADHSASP